MPETSRGTVEKIAPPAKRTPALPLLLAAGLVTGVLMALLILNGGLFPQGEHVPGGGLPTPIPDRVSAGEQAPVLMGETLDGEAVSLSDYAGQPVAVNFWATWCVPCRVEMPALARAAERYSDARLVVLAVNAGESQEVVQDYVDELGITFPVVLDPAYAIVNQYEVRVYPTTFWIDRDGVLIAEHFGALTDDLIDAYMEDLLHE